MDASAGSQELYRCLWCDPKQQRPEEFKELRLWYKIIGIETGWIYDYCGMCDSCVKSEWKEYRRDYEHYALRDEVEQRAYDHWHLEVSWIVRQASVRFGILEDLKLVYAGSGGKPKMLRTLKKQFWARRHESGPAP